MASKRVMVCDAASANVATIKASCGDNGAYGMKSEASDPHQIEPWFQNPFDPSRRILWVICPSHQVIHSILFHMYI